MLVEYRDGSAVPHNETKALNSVRFDSAKAALGNGPHHGAVFTDFIPTLELSMRAGSNHTQEELVPDRDCRLDVSPRTVRQDR